MKAEYINSFYRATKDVLQMMIDISPERGDLKMVNGLTNNKDANVELGVTGDLSGTILFSFPKKTTLEMVKIMSGMDMDKIDNFASSALGEMANIISGNALTNLSEYNFACDIQPPQVFLGGYKPATLNSEKVLLLPLYTSIGNLIFLLY